MMIKVKRKKSAKVLKRSLSILGSDLLQWISKKQKSIQGLPLETLALLFHLTYDYIYSFSTKGN